MHERTQIKLRAADRAELEAVVADRNSPQKHVWRAKIVLLTAAGHGTAEIKRQTGKAKTVIWRWQERFTDEGVDGLWRDKTRPARIPPLSAEIAERVVALTLAGPPSGATHWTGAAMAEAARISVSSVQRIWRAHGLQPHRVRQFKLSNDPESRAPRTGGISPSRPPAPEQAGSPLRRGACSPGNCSEARCKRTPSAESGDAGSRGGTGSRRRSASWD